MVATSMRVLTGAVMSIVSAVAVLWLATLMPGPAPARADTTPAHADNVRCDPSCHGTWCPGDPITFRVADLATTWDPNVCHEYHQVAGQPGVYAEGPLPAGTFVCPPFAFMCP